MTFATGCVIHRKRRLALQNSKKTSSYKIYRYSYALSILQKCDARDLGTDARARSEREERRERLQAEGRGLPQRGERKCSFDIYIIYSIENREQRG